MERDISMRAAQNSSKLDAAGTVLPGKPSGAGPAEPPPNGEELSANGNHRKVFARVPTHVIGVASERRIAPRAKLDLPLRLVGEDGDRPSALRMINISSTGVYFLSPQPLEPGTSVELEVNLLERPRGRGGVRLQSIARVVRSEPSATPGWHGVAAALDDIRFHRDEAVPSRFLKP